MRSVYQFSPLLLSLFYVLSQLVYNDHTENCLWHVHHRRLEIHVAVVSSQNAPSKMAEADGNLQLKA